MELIKVNRLWGNLSTLERLVLASLVTLPYVIYGAVVTLASFLVISLHRWWGEIWRRLCVQGWVWLSLGLGVGVLLSTAPGESALQVFNFVPFFVFYAAIAATIPKFKHPLTALHSWGVALLIATVPINLAAVAEFYLRAPESLARWGSYPGLQWLYLQTDYGHRASAVFGHPNTLANYMVIVFGLGLGLCAYYLNRPELRRRGLWICAATALALVGIYCSGSRNGLLIAGLQLLLFGGLLRPYRYIFWAGLGAMALVTASALVWGIGGRTLGEAFATVSVRFNVWQLALEMIPRHPWFGSGLGTFKLLYDPADFSVAGDFLPHTHNLWLMLAAEAGIPVALGFTVVVGWVVGRSTYALLRSPLSSQGTALMAGYFTGFGGTVAFALFDMAFYDARINILGWLMLGIIQGIADWAVTQVPKST